MAFTALWPCTALYGPVRVPVGSAWTGTWHGRVMSGRVMVGSCLDGSGHVWTGRVMYGQMGPGTRALGPGYTALLLPSLPDYCGITSGVPGSTLNGGGVKVVHSGSLTCGSHMTQI